MESLGHGFYLQELRISGKTFQCLTPPVFSLKSATVHMGVGTGLRQKRQVWTEEPNTELWTASMTEKNTGGGVCWKGGGHREKRVHIGTKSLLGLLADSNALC